MLNLFKRLTNLSIVSSVLQKTMEYPDVHHGFELDRKNLYKNRNKFVRDFNRNLRTYSQE